MREKAPLIQERVRKLAPLAYMDAYPGPLRTYRRTLNSIPVRLTEMSGDRNRRRTRYFYEGFEGTLRGSGEKTVFSALKSFGNRLMGFNPQFGMFHMSASVVGAYKREPEECVYILECQGFGSRGSMKGYSVVSTSESTNRAAEEVKWFMNFMQGYENVSAHLFRPRQEGSNEDRMRRKVVGLRTEVLDLRQRLKDERAGVGSLQQKVRRLEDDLKEARRKLVSGQAFAEEITGALGTPGVFEPGVVRRMRRILEERAGSEE